MHIMYYAFFTCNQNTPNNNTKCHYIRLDGQVAIMVPWYWQQTACSNSVPDNDSGMQSLRKIKMKVLIEPIIWLFDHKRMSMNSTAVCREQRA